MAKENRPKGRIRVFLFELEGSDDTLLESVRSIAGAVSRTFTQPSVRAMAAALPLAADSSEQMAGAEALLGGGASGLDDGESSEPATVKGKRSRGFPSPQLIPLDPPNSDSLKAFCAARAPRDHRNRYMVIATWWKEQRAVDEVTIDHIYTGYRTMGWTAPKDMRAIFRDGKRDGYFTRGANRGFWKTTHVAADRVLSPGKGGGSS